LWWSQVFNSIYFSFCYWENYLCSLL
jgi:hypothetical protein